jgi:putative zinc finger protein
MCDFSDKLVAWLDRELSMDEASKMERHLGVCSECCTRVDAYRKISVALDAYCEAASTARARRVAPLRTLAVAGAGAAALALFLVRPHTRVEKPGAIPPPAAISSAIAREAEPVAEAAPSPIKQIHRRHSVTAGARSAPADWSPAEPAVQIAIPAEALLPPGAAPQGVSFVADLSIAPDGSAQRLRLQPQLIAFERSR